MAIEKIGTEIFNSVQSSVKKVTNNEAQAVIASLKQLPDEFVSKLKTDTKDSPKGLIAKVKAYLVKKLEATKKVAKERASDSANNNHVSSKTPLEENNGKIRKTKKLGNKEKAEKAENIPKAGKVKSSESIRKIKKAGKAEQSKFPHIKTKPFFENDMIAKFAMNLGINPNITVQSLAQQAKIIAIEKSSLANVIRKKISESEIELAEKLRAYKKSKKNIESCLNTFNEAIKGGNASLIKKAETDLEGARKLSAQAFSELQTSAKYLKRFEEISKK